MKSIRKIFNQSFHEILSLAIPLALSQVGQIIIQMTDSMMIGRVGSVPLAASAFASSLFSVFLIVGLAGSTAIASLVSRAHGAGQKAVCAELLRHSIWIGGWVALGFGLMLYSMSYFLQFFGQDPQVAIEAKVYVQLLAASMIPLALYQACRQFCEGLSAPKPPMLAMFAGVVLNVFLNWILIYGNWGAPALGLAGAGWATLASRVFMLGLLCWILARSSFFRDYLPKTYSWRGLQNSYFSKLFKLGVPSGLQGLFEVGAFGFATVMVGWIGVEALAAHQISLNLASFTFIFVLSLSFVANIRVGLFLGQNRAARAKQEGILTILCGAGLMLSFGLIILAFRFQLPAFYIQEVEVIELAAKLLIIAAIFQVFDGTQAVALGALRGLQDVRIPTLIAFLAYWVVALPLAYLFGFRWEAGVVGVWIGLACGLAFAACALFARFILLSRRLVIAEQNR